MSQTTGIIHGGQQPIQDSHVYLFAANTTGGYGSASTSLLSTGAGTDSNGNVYVTTEAHGGFSYSVTCPTPTTQVYLLALGGNPGFPGGDQNDAIALSAALGNCGNITTSTFTFIDESTTVAMAFALNKFMVDPIHVGSPASNTAGLKAAFATANNLVDTTSGAALATIPSGHGTAPQLYINTLANIISSCVNTANGSTAPCAQLFSAASTTAGGTPTDTLGALLNIAAFPSMQTAALYGLSAAVAPNQPSLTSQPNDFTLGITYEPVGLTAVQPGAVVIDASGNIWMANCQSCLNPTAPDSLLEFASDGTFLHSFTGSAVPGTQVLHQIKGIAIDAASANIYTVNQGIPGGPAGGIGDDQIVKMDLSTGTVQAGFPIDFDQATYGVDTFNGITLDNSGEIWATATNTGAIIEATPSGNLINGSPFFVGGTLGVATDNIGNIWFAGVGGNNIIEFDTNGDFLQNFTPPGLNQPLSMAINASNELLAINSGSNTVSKIEFFNGNNGSGSPYSSVGLYKASVIAVDGANQMLIPNCRLSCPGSGSTLPDNLLRLSQAGAPNTGGTGASYGAQIPTFSGAGGGAIDASGNVWVSNSVSGNITQVIGYAAPTIQPLALASSNGTIGQMP